MNTYSIPNTPIKILLEPLYFEYNGKTEKIPAGYAYDGLSIPQVFQWVVDMNQTNNIVAGLIHDYFYSEACHITLSRKEADCRLFQDVDGLGSYPVYYGVRLGGGFSWKKDRNYKQYREQIEGARKTLGLNKLT